MKDSADWLRDWVEHGSEDAFAKLVAGHIDLVYSAAVRKVAGDTGLAADVTQTVFTDLARKARWLRAEGSLAGWLHRHTCFTAATALRGELRRRAREQTAAAMHALESDTPDWPHLAPLLDDAVNALGDADRRAVLLRFYERRDLREVGSALGVGEDAAQKRVARALDKLRDWLARRGITSTGTALAAVLTAHGVAAAPAGLAATVTTTAVAAAGTAAGVGTLTLLEFMIHFKTKLAVGAAVAAVVATPVVWQETVLAKTRAENRALAAQVETPRPLGAEQAPPAPTSEAQLAAERAAREREELNRLRKEIPPMRERLQQMRAGRLATVPASRSLNDPAHVAGSVISLRNAQDVGAATGEALIQTFSWAMNTANTNRLMQLCDLSSEDAREGIEKFMRQLPSAKDMEEVKRSTHDVSIRLVRQVTLEDGDGAIIVAVVDRPDTGRDAIRIRRFGHEWRVVMGKYGPKKVDLPEELMRD